MATDSSHRPPDDEDIRDKLDRLGRERTELNERDMDLHDDIAAAIEESRGVVPKAEAARRLGLHRTTLYRVYDG